MTPLLNDDVLTPEPCGWSRSRVMQFAEKAGRTLGYQIGDDLKPLVRRMGGKIELADSDVGSTGLLKVNGPGDFTIALSWTSPANRDRFTIAHELGHYVLHAKMGELHPMTIRRDGGGRLEWEANWFAAGFLMPEARFKEWIGEGYGNATLAVKFGVSEAAVSIRRETLGI